MILANYSRHRHTRKHKNRVLVWPPRQKENSIKIIENMKHALCWKTSRILQAYSLLHKRKRKNSVFSTTNIYTTESSTQLQVPIWKETPTDNYKMWAGKPHASRLHNSSNNKPNTGLPRVVAMLQIFAVHLPRICHYNCAKCYLTATKGANVLPLSPFANDRHVVFPFTVDNRLSTISQVTQYPMIG